MWIAFTWTVQMAAGTIYPAEGQLVACFSFKALSLLLRLCD